MSGGHFNYKQHSLLDMADDIGSEILNNDSEEKMSGGTTSETVTALKP